ncbi:MAG: BON domain-containing protein [Actinobacteria bacterium]|nr:BON domain-containing protein [Actinomycetota bacterium]
MSRKNDLEGLAQSLLDSDAGTRNYELKVRVNGGVAQVTGIVDTLSEKEQVDQILSGVGGLRGIENSVAISTDGSIIDEDVVGEVIEELKADPAVDLHGVGAKSVRGNVYLVGTVDGPEEEKAAIRAASRARGVKSVVSRLKISRNDYDTGDLRQIFHHQVNNDREVGEEVDRMDFY